MKKLLLVSIAVGFYALANAQTTIPSSSVDSPSGAIDSTSSDSAADTMGTEDNSEKRKQRMQGDSELDTDSDVNTLEGQKQESGTMDSSPSTIAPTTNP